MIQKSIYYILKLDTLLILLPVLIGIGFIFGLLTLLHRRIPKLVFYLWLFLLFTVGSIVAFAIGGWGGLGLPILVLIFYIALNEKHLREKASGQLFINFIKYGIAVFFIVLVCILLFRIVFHS